MNPVLLARHEQLRAMRARRAADPAHHAATALALPREFALLQAAADLPAYLAASDSGFELARAAWLDRQRALLQVALDLNDPLNAEGAAAALHAALQAHGQAGWVDAVRQGAAQQAAWQARAARSQAAAQRALLNLLLCEGGEPWQGGNPRADAAQAWQDACEADPSLARAVATDALDQHPLAASLPWRGAALQRLQTALRGLPVPEASGPAARRLEDLQAGAGAGLAAWAGHLGPLPPMARASEDALVHDPETDRDLDHARVVQAAWADLDALQRQQTHWPEPLRQAHVHRLREALEATRSELQALAAITHHQAAFGVETHWQALLVCAATLPLRALVGVAVLGQAQRGGLARAVDWAHSLCGLGPRALLQQPELQRRLRQHWLPRLAGWSGDDTVGPADAGADLLAPLQAWVAMRLNLPPGAATVTTDGLVQALCQHLDELGVEEPAPASVALALWGQAGTLSSWPGWMTAPPRPPARDPGPLFSASPCDTLPAGGSMR